MPPIFTSLLAERLGKQSRIAIAEGRAGVNLAAGQAWIAPGNFHMTVACAGGHARLELNQEPPRHSCRPAVDVLFRSVASAYRAHVLGVIMTGMGADGVQGAQQIREAGGEVIIQDEASAVVWGMPGLVYAAGQADGVYPAGPTGSGDHSPGAGKPEHQNGCNFGSVGFPRVSNKMTMAASTTMTKPAPGREAVDPIYRQIRDLVYKVSGIFQLEEKLYLLVDGCGRRMKQLAVKTTREYWDMSDRTCQPGG